MSKGRNSSVYLFVILGVLVLGLIGYNLSQRSVPNQPTPPTPTPGQTGVTPSPAPGTGGQSLSTPGTSPTASNSDIERSKRISQQIVALGNVKRAPVVVDGNRAIVGLQLIDSSNAGVNKVISAVQNQAAINPNTTGVTGTKSPGTPSTTPRVSTTMSLSDAIAQRIRTIDTGITKVSVTTDPKVFDRVQKLSDTMTSEINDIFNKVPASSTTGTTTGTAPGTAPGTTTTPGVTPGTTPGTAPRTAPGTTGVPAR